jgi:Na+-driven multidrug efflux pump
MRLAGEDGVAANGIIMYVAFIFIAMFIGFAVGTAPIIGYHYGAKNTDELASLLKKGATIMLTAGLAMSVISIALARPLSMIFAGYDPELVEITANGLRIHSTCFAFASLGIFGSSYFTALNNGLVSAIISFTRTLIFQVGALLLLPIFLDLNGVWLATPISEVLSLILTVILFIANRRKYKYF